MVSAILFRLALAASCASLLKGDEALQDNRTASHGTAPRLSALPRSAQVRLSWWSRGGEPGPGYTSDKLDVVATGGTVSGTYVRARFDQSFDPPFKAEEFTGEIPQAAWDQLMAAIDGERLFAMHRPAEDKGDIADALKDTVSVSVDGHVSEKTLFDLADGDLRGPRSLVRGMADYLVAHGRHRVLKQPQTGR